MSRIWDDQSIQKQSELLVLLALADFANDEGQCWPSVSRLAHKTRISERSIQYLLKSLVSDGRLLKLKSGGKRVGDSNVYRISLGCNPCTRGVEKEGLGVQTDAVLGCTSFAPNPSVQPSIEQSHSERCLFERFWEHYPKKVGRVAALLAWKERNLDRLTETIITAVQNQSRREASWKLEGGRFIPHPATWLNQERWLDDSAGLKQTNEIDRLVAGALKSCAQ